MRCFVVAGFLLTSASRGPSAIAEPLVIDDAHLHISPSLKLTLTRMAILCNFRAPVSADSLLFTVPFITLRIVTLIFCAIEMHLLTYLHELFSRNIVSAR